MNTPQAPRRASRGAVLSRVPVLLLVPGAVALGQVPGDVVVPPGAQAAPPEVTFEERIDPWSRWRLKLYAEQAGARGGMEARLLTHRLDAHELQAGATVSLSRAEPGPLEPWQALDERRSALFIEDGWRWSPQWTLSAGARLVEVPGGVGLHERLALAWQPDAALNVRLTDGTVHRPGLGGGLASVQRVRGLEVQTELSAGRVRMTARGVSQQVGDAGPLQAMQAAIVSLGVPLDRRWQLGSDTQLASDLRPLTRLRLTGSLRAEGATVSLLMPYRVQRRAADIALHPNLPALEPDDGLVWRARVEVKF